jgi:hypothetical protein
MFLNDCDRDRLFLKACFEGDSAALSQWSVDSYWTEVARAMKEASDKLVSGRLSRELLTSLIVDCTWAIYEQHRTFPSHIFGLKTRARRYAFAYMRKYLTECQ